MSMSTGHEVGFRQENMYIISDYQRLVHIILLVYVHNYDVLFKKNKMDFTVCKFKHLYWQGFSQLYHMSTKSSEGNANEIVGVDSWTFQVSSFGMRALFWRYRCVLFFSAPDVRPSWPVLLQPTLRFSVSDGIFARSRFLLTVSFSFPSPHEP